MKTCRTASLFACGALFGLGAMGACREAAAPDVPPVTAAQPAAATDTVLSGPATSASLATPGDSGAAAVPAQEPPMTVAIVDLPVKIDVTPCSEAAVAVVEGTAIALGEQLGAGDVMLVRDGDSFEVKGKGVAVTTHTTRRDTGGGERCQKTRLAQSKEVVRIAGTPELTWAKGAMRARLQVGEKQRSSFYLGRLEGSAPVAEHAHAGTWEILAAIDAAGTFVLDGRESRLGSRQVVFVPPDTKHAWRPDPGSTLRAVQIYTPHGPEQRFLALAAAEKDAGVPAAGSSR